MKNLRQSAILEVVDQEPIRSQDRLRLRLRARGFDVTQATLSRDIKEIGLVKRAADGAYQRPTGPSMAPDPEVVLRRAVGDYMRRIQPVQQLVVIHTFPGAAQPLAVALDQAVLSELVGTVAGDDTVLAICPDARKAKTLVKRLEAWGR